MPDDEFDAFCNQTRGIWLTLRVAPRAAAWIRSQRDAPGRAVARRARS